MSKAYDRVEWGYLEKILLCMGFDMTWVSKVMGYVRSVHYIVKCNSKLSETFLPERGLRQGDPISLYLFLFCMDSLSRLLINTQHVGLIRGIRASQNNNRINHLFFPDDALLFIRNK